MVVPAELYPFTPNFVAVGAAQKMHYVDEGQGPAILMVHGNPTWSFYYRNLIKEFSSSHRVIAPDHIGCGMSDKPADEDYDYTLETRVQNLAKLVATLNLTNITLVVHDWGGMIGFAFATRYPELIERLVVFNTAAFHNPRGQELPLSIRLCRDRFVGEWLVRGLGAFSLGANRRCCTKKKLSSAEQAAYLAPYNNWQNRRAVHRFVKDIPLTEADPAWRVVAEVEKNLYKLKDKPMLILWGEQDFVFDDAFLKRWREFFPAASVQTFADSGHYVVEDAHDEIVTALSQFLAVN